MKLSFLDNNSRFGQVMHRLGILIAANLLFLLTCLPVITMGAGLAALYHTLLRALRAKWEINPFAEFVKGLKGNFRQATIAFLALAALFALLALEVFWCSQFSGPVALFRYGLYAIGFAALVIALYLFPTLAAFDAPLKKLVLHSLYFAMKNPLLMLRSLLSLAVPVLLTVVHIAYRPLYAFLWCMIGVSALALWHACGLIRLYLPHLPRVDLCGDVIPEGMDADFAEEAHPQRDVKTMLDDMMKLGM